jgi:glycosyltransferase involved in cell wall biosynthesis
VIVAAHNEADLLAGTLGALAGAFPGAALWLADDGSGDGSAEIALACGAKVVRSPRRAGKGAAMTRAAAAALAAMTSAEEATFVLCDGDLGESAAALAALADAVEVGTADLAIASFADPRGGGFGLLRGFARRVLRERAGLELRAPLSGQRALTGRSLRALLPFADGFGMELGMTLDARAAGMSVVELELDLRHRARGRTPAGFAHRARQFAHVSRAARAARARVT